MILIRPIPFTIIEALTNLRYMRKIRNDLQKDLRELQERVRGGHDGHHNAACLALDAEIAVIEEIIRKLWEAYNAAVPPALPPPPTDPPKS